eukprot:scaffold36095_cov59-Phaeocystis_antarctica.AAC.1
MLLLSAEYSPSGSAPPAAPEGEEPVMAARCALPPTPATSASYSSSASSSSIAELSELLCRTAHLSGGAALSDRVNMLGVSERIGLLSRRTAWLGLGFLLGLGLGLGRVRVIGLGLGLRLGLGLGLGLIPRLVPVIAEKRPVVEGTWTRDRR